MKIKIKRTLKEAKLPTRSSDLDAGYDLYSAARGTLYCHVHRRALVKTGISVSIPKGYYGRVAPRSGLALRDGIGVLGGVIDSGYRGEIGVILINSGVQDFDFYEGDRIAQLIIEKCHDIEWEECDSLEDSDRGEGGFGSTGK
jgi:dUTP pyrophosphatase